MSTQLVLNILKMHLFQTSAPADVDRVAMETPDICPKL